MLINVSSDTGIVIDSEPHPSRTCKQASCLLHWLSVFTLAVPLLRYSCEGRIEKSVTHDHRLSSSASLAMPNGDPRDGLFYPTLTLMIDSYNIANIILQCSIGWPVDYIENR